MCIKMAEGTPTLVDGLHIGDASSEKDLLSRAYNNTEVMIDDAYTLIGI